MCKRDLEKGKKSWVAQPASRVEGDGYIVDLRQVVKTFVTPAGDFSALKGVDLLVSAGEFVSITGKSGSGKSTLINMITGIDRPSGGEVYVNHIAVHRLNEEEIALWRGRSIGVIFQFFQLLPTLTATENVMLPMDYLGCIPRLERPAWAEHLLELVDMAGSSHRLPAELSGGELQRVAIARALANDPPLVTADEPTGNLDQGSASSVIDLFKKLVADGKTILMVTHDNDLASQSGRTIEIADGNIIDEIIRR